MADKDNVFSRLIPITTAVLALTILWFYWPVLAKLFVHLAEDEDYSFGLLLPLVSGYIVYLKLPQIRSYLWRPSWLGPVFIGLGFALYVVGELGADLYVPRVSFVIVMAGLLFLMGGWGLVRLLLFPLFLLILMFPLPGLLTKQLTLPLQLISSRLATAILQLVGIPAFCQGNIIDLGVRQMQIVEACSGLRYILPLLALGLIFCYFYQRRWWKALVLLVFLVPLAMVANALRVTAMALYPPMLQGFWHGFSGWLIFLFCLGALAGLNGLLNRLWPPRPGSHPPKERGEASAPRPAGNPLPHLAAALALLLVAIPLVHRAASAPPVPLKRSFAAFPLEIGLWRGKITPVDPEMVRLTQSHAHLNVDYVNPDHGVVNLWIAYYETQKKAGGFVHSPKGCLIASGWRFLESGTYEIAPGRPVNYLLAEQMGTRMVVFYWYLQRGRWLTSEYWNKFYMAWDGLTRRRTDGALIRLITPAGEDIPAAQQRLAGFAQSMAPVLSEFVPH
jgi:exosortase D (VPLPA-CTERM-specific)